MSLFRPSGPRARKLVSLLRRRAAAPPKSWKSLDELAHRALTRTLGIVFTDTADFTLRVERDGIVHFLMLLARLGPGARRAAARYGGRLVKVEADSLLLDFPDATSACRGVIALERHLHRLNRGKPRSLGLRFSYGIGYGEVLALEDDLFGLEVNLASKIGEDLARPGQALLTPSARENLDRAMRRRVAPYGRMTLGPRSLSVARLRLPRG